ncbi:MAG: aspartate kinase [Paracoccus sp. (in: a-proteobacteria)]|jgi:aspartate kinase|uniref:aspartate kinase n=1 Tax=unclassified Paracoccus (in: a-proteobacteria) TaxID=2688777 RepID=UPI000C586188|nr:MULTISPECIES: aspartate kinase [unclassified Paracoccus (in: a-proteobacteria)]MAN55900.1 aspartate kinase [Paracoccus sp. (in: a-proteobacteria)]MBA48180.1 aspartate kinase [Paracoccus sp. (in: a-proteobacteria)]MCS5601666.1 aspartate kinase [Paracoccus sp. (in: a-proteobacteria)]MDB2551745.1 aspartate kinase [Paracoccus sp. (in: a-proteobacteria)]HIC67143.1 aspartate kinase [Paracoccus sp. (in: a-proteobacteria)]|tara:strand:- start:9916 stop:11172 length:1257 start_codon:yes stop_codon:yes gene_type:complete
MPLLVMKFGGTSVADLDRIRNAAAKVQREVERGHDVIVIVSAMSGKTNELVGWVEKTSPLFDAREYDAVVSSGENVTAGLMALTLQEMGVPARSWQGWQVPINTTAQHSAARFVDIPRGNLDQKFAEGFRVAVVAGFQGLAPDGRITTLGRGGSDTTAVAFAAAFDAERCDIYTDVDGIYTTDPRITSKARKLDRIAFEEMLELASLGAKVLQTRSVELAMRYKVRLRVLSSFEDTTEDSGTLVCDEGEIMESKVVNGVAYSREEAKITLVTVEDRPGISAGIFAPLADAGVNVDMIVQNISEKNFEHHQGSVTDMTFSVPINQVDRAKRAMEQARAAGTVSYDELIVDTEVAKVSVVGIGMRSHAGVAARMFKALAEENINIKVIATSEIKISVLIDRKYMELAVQALHDAFGLEAA